MSTLLPQDPGIPSGDATPKPFHICIYNNFGDDDPDDCDHARQFATAAEAIAKCKAIVDHSLLHLYELGMSAEDLAKSHHACGNSPSLAGPGEVRFSASEYVVQRCAQIAGGTKAN